ncbi:unnamed protein product [Closterium sp. NIES-64]|nr:unnamed protein product [Closterium sp. NIES-64]
MCMCFLLSYLPLSTVPLPSPPATASYQITGGRKPVLLIGLAANMMCGGAFSYHWGRKPVLLIGLAANMVCGGAFGLCTSFHAAMLCRLLHGLLSTIAATGRTTVAELCDSTNQGTRLKTISFQTPSFQFHPPSHFLKPPIS